MRGAIDFETYGGFGNDADEVKPLFAGFMWGPHGARKHTHLHDATHKQPDLLAENALRVMLAITEVDVWYAHNAGKFDGLLLSAAAKRLGWAQSAVIAGGNRVIEWTFKPHSGKRNVVLRDSFAVVPSKLSAAAKDFELPSAKLFTDDDYRQDTRTWDIERLREGCLIDCRIVLEMIERVETLVESWEGELKLTFSSTALSIVRANLSSEGRLLPSFEGRQEWNAVARHAYHGGRVEVYRHMPSEWLDELDVSSSYPYSMLQVMPWEPVGSYIGNEALQAFLRGNEGVFKAKVTVPDCYLPPLPYKLPCNPCLSKGKLSCEHLRQTALYFPTGTWIGWFAGNELRYAVEECGVDAVILEAQTYTAEQPFAEFINRVYAVKQTARGAVRNFAKLVLNGCYGKFAQKPETSSLKVFNSEDEMRAHAFANPGRVTPVGKATHAAAIATYRWPSQTHYALASYITAGSRILLHRSLMAAKGICYADTDSVHCTENGFPKELQGNALGQLKLEMGHFHGKYYAPKIYRLDAGNGEVHYAAKGFTVNCDGCRYDDPSIDCTCDDTFRQIIEGERVNRGRMQLIKSQLRKSPDAVRYVIDKKKWSGLSNKRFPYPDGETRPWSVLELVEGSHKKAKSPGFHDPQIEMLL